MARGLNKAILQQLREDKDDAELVQKTWEKTLEEVNLGYIWHDEHADPMQFFLAKRFGLVQRAGKLRVMLGPETFSMAYFKVFSDQRCHTL